MVSFLSSKSSKNIVFQGIVGDPLGVAEGTELGKNVGPVDGDIDGLTLGAVLGE